MKAYQIAYNIIFKLKEGNYVQKDLQKHVKWEPMKNTDLFSFASNE